MHCPHLAIALALAAGVLTVAANVAGLVGTAKAQQAQRIMLNVASIMLAEPGSRTPLPIQVGPQDAVSKNSFVRIRGLPPAASLSEGHAISPGSWAVPLSALSSLNIVLPVGVQGQWSAIVALVTIDGNILAEAKMNVITAQAQAVAPPGGRQAGPAPPSTSVASLTPTAPPMNSPARERALGLLAKGQEQLQRGNVYPARMFFQRAAEAGLAESALALGGTFDPDELAKIKVFGLQPDIAAARKWYEKAQELGAPEAAERLRRLGAP